jgi:hypothetical protein
MELQTAKATRRSTRIRVEIPVSVISLDRRRPFGEKCMVLIVSAQGCGFRSSEALEIETPIMLSGLPGGGSVTARVANCLPLGNDGKYFLVGVSLYTHGNVWGIANPPEDWKVAAQSTPTLPTNNEAVAAPQLKINKKVWPYNLFTEGAENHPGHK